MLDTILSVDIGPYVVWGSVIAIVLSICEKYIVNKRSTFEQTGVEWAITECVGLAVCAILFFAAGVFWATILHIGKMMDK